MGIDRIDTDPQNLSISAQIFGHVPLESAGFQGATGSKVFGIKVNDDPFASIVGKRNGAITCIGGQGEFGGRLVKRRLGTSKRVGNWGEIESGNECKAKGKQQAEERSTTHYRQKRDYLK